MIKKRNLDPSLVSWIMTQTGLGPGMGDVGYIAPAVSTTSRFRQMLLDDGVSGVDMFTTLTLAEAGMTNYQNDVMIAMPGWYEETATTDWDLYDSHLIGTSPALHQSRVDLVQTTNAFSPAWTLSGRGNSWANITFRHGTAEADYIGLTVSGRYNYLNNIYMMSPMVQTQADHASYEGVRVSGHNNYFRYCRLGTDGTPRAGANFNVNVYGGIGNVFEDCFFSANIDATDPSFVYCDNGVRDMRHCYFKNCTFLAYSVGVTPTAVMAKAIQNNYGANTLYVILENCNFVNVTAISDTSDDQWIWKHTMGDTAAAAATGIAVRNLGA